MEKKNNINITDHLDFVHMVACHYAYTGIPHEDLYSEGVLGLIDAAERYDPDRGVVFISYAVWWIKQKIVKYIAANSRVVYIPLNINQKNGKAKKEIARLEQEKQREIDEFDISTKGYYFPVKISFDSKAAGCKEATVLDCFNHTDYKGDEYSNRLTPENEMYRYVISIAKKHLRPQQKKIFLSYFEDGYTLDICGKINGGVTRERARQVLKLAIKNVQNRLKIEGLCVKEK